MSPRARDAALAALFAVWQVAERLTSPMVEGPAPVNVVAGLVMAAALWWRRADPAIAAGVLVTGGIVSAVGGSPPSNVTASLAAIVLIGFAAGRHVDAPRRWWIAGSLGLSVATIDVLDIGSGGFVFPLLVVGTSAVIGGLLRDRATMTRELVERTHELEALREAGERGAVLDERRRIARELHDVVAHTVSVMVVQAAGARRQLDRDPERARAALRQVRETGEDTLAELERLFGVLHADEPAGGLDEIPALVERVRAAGLPVEIEVTGAARPLDPKADVAAFRVVQEALTNTLKHAGPATARVTVRWEHDELELVVSDTGWGADGPRGDGSRRGLVGMRERIEPFGGDVQAGPRAAGGFEVRARLPLAREEVPA